MTWQEAKGRCPFCLETIERTSLGHGTDIEHLVPRCVVDCNEFYNLTVAHLKCNRERKGEQTPFAAFRGTSLWPDIKDNAEKTFTGRKLEIFLSPNAEELIEQKADLQHTAYIARVIRHISLVRLTAGVDVSNNVVRHVIHRHLVNWKEIQPAWTP